jgi:hypothetical protein
LCWPWRTPQSPVNQKPKMKAHRQHLLSKPSEVRSDK